MSNPLRTSEDYELFLYTLGERFPSVCRSTVTLVRRGAALARVAGTLYFDHNIRLVVRERLVYHRLPVTIDWYGYEVWRGEEKQEAGGKKQERSAEDWVVRWLGG